LREYTSTYSVDERISVLDFILGIFKKRDNEGESLVDTLYKLQDQTARFIKGNIEAKEFAALLTASFGKRIPDASKKVILENLPASKAAELKKFI
jgi:hypothetical protein